MIFVRGGFEIFSRSEGQFSSVGSTKLSVHISSPLPVFRNPTMLGRISRHCFVPGDLLLCVSPRVPPGAKNLPTTLARGTGPSPFQTLCPASLMGGTSDGSLSLEILCLAGVLGILLLPSARVHLTAQQCAIRSTRHCWSSRMPSDPVHVCKGCRSQFLSKGSVASHQRAGSDCAGCGVEIQKVS